MQNSRCPNRAAALIPMAMALVLGATAALGQANSPFGGFKHDNTQPIEITSDALEVQQANNIAIFTGEVIAGQGTLRLTADRVEVFYDREETQGDTGAIKRLRAEGNVLLSNGSETAKGAWGEYDVVAGMMRMGGSVILTQGANAINGESLVIDLNAGTGRVEGGGSAGGRVKSVFSPSSSDSNTN
ncbi:MAG: lipopolysaccharide transport periplasmic protein LptA [Pseudomonadota bacterium]